MSVQSYQAEPFDDEEERDNDWSEPLNEADCVERLALLAAELADFDAQRANRDQDFAQGSISQAEHDRWTHRWKIARRYKAREHEALKAWLKAYRAATESDPAVRAAALAVEARKAEAKAVTASALLLKQQSITSLKRAELDAKAQLWASLAKAAEAKLDPTTAAGKLALAIERQHEEFAQLVWIFEEMTARGIDVGPHARKVYRNAKKGMPPGYYERWLTGDRFAAWDVHARANDKGPIEVVRHA